MVSNHKCSLTILISNQSFITNLCLMVIYFTLRLCGTSCHLGVILILANISSKIWKIGTKLPGILLYPTNILRLTSVLLAPYIYIRFQTCFRSMEISLKLIKRILCRCLVNPIIKYWRYLFFININIFHHLKLEIALAIPASNE